MNIINLSPRHSIWIALSAFYLDTELQPFELHHIAMVIQDSPYSLEEIKQINKREVFPVLKSNLLSVAGIWSGFNEDEVVRLITHRLQRKNILSDIFNEIWYWLFGSMCNDYWQK